MGVREGLAAIFAFSKWPVTILSVAVYTAVFISVAVLDELPPVPGKGGQLGLDIDRAYDDLHKIAGLPHPYNSHQNDVVRSYILDRVQSLTSGNSYAHVDDDMTSNVTFGLLDGATEAYFEGSNVLVKINGTNAELPAVLFSAHFDSVSTAPGATDDGMGVATLLALLEYFTKHRPKRNVVFNINNAEEDGLYGAHAFIEHPWFYETSDFINLEGAGAGGRPLLLRATSTRLAQAWSKVPHPHALVMSADAFNRGLVKSGTDYAVYQTAGRDGLDFSFYRQRSKYHTKEDGIPSLGGKAALWSMMESSLKAGLALVDDEGRQGNETPVYFDLFGEALAVAPLKIFYIINIVLLVVGPLVIGTLLFLAFKQNKLYWAPSGWGRVPSAIILGGGLTIALGMLYLKVNKFIVYSSPAAVFISTSALNSIIIYIVYELFGYFLPVPQTRSVALFENYIFWWILLVVDTAFIGAHAIAGLYFLTLINAGALAALLIDLLEHFVLPSASRGDNKNATGAIDDDDDRPGREGSNERTPLLAVDGRPIKKSEISESDGIGLWIMEFLLSVPIPVILLAQVAVMILNALNQTLADGSSAATVYLTVSVLSTLIFVPFIPFVHKVHRFVPSAVFIVLVITVLYNVFAFPFSENSPLKVFFQQTIDLDSGNNTVTLTGVDPWISRRIVPELPSSWETDHVCNHTDPLRSNLPACQWESLSPHVGTGKPSSWLSVNATETAPGMGLISVSGLETRNCRLYFDFPVSAASVRGASGEIQELYPVSKDGVTEVRLWSRTWERVFEVSVAWEGAEPLTGRAACEWAEASAIPALEEVLSFLPKWARVTKRTDGLLEGYKAFTMAGKSL